mmetsp:Transcript_49494/g.105817  ORF Transcript_49494/g.105817 Transcript_49494/m.105817 type:complete len:234 (-) Transcript_49494:667-1368(-)
MRWQRGRRRSGEGGRRGELLRRRLFDGLRRGLFEGLRRSLGDVGRGRNRVFATASTSQVARSIRCVRGVRDITCNAACVAQPEEPYLLTQCANLLLEHAHILDEELGDQGTQLLHRFVANSQACLATQCAVEDLFRLEAVFPKEVARVVPGLVETCEPHRELGETSDAAAPRLDHASASIRQVGGDTCRGSVEGRLHAASRGANSAAPADLALCRSVAFACRKVARALIAAQG